ncbi:hypothetical protein WKT05_02660 [Peptoniphilus sp. HCN-40583]
MYENGVPLDYMAASVATITLEGLKKIKNRVRERTNAQNAKGVETLYRHLLFRAGLDDVTIDSIVYASHRNDQEFKEFLKENAADSIDFGEFETPKIGRPKAEAVAEPYKSFYRPLEVGEAYTVELPHESGGRPRIDFGTVTGKVIDETRRFYLIEAAHGLKTTVLKNDLCLEKTKIKKIAQR